MRHFKAQKVILCSQPVINFFSEREKIFLHAYLHTQGHKNFI